MSEVVVLTTISRVSCVLTAALARVQQADQQVLGRNPMKPANRSFLIFRKFVYRYYPRRGDIEYCDGIYIVVVDTCSQKVAARRNLEIGEHRQFRKIRSRRCGKGCFAEQAQKTDTDN